MSSIDNRYATKRLPVPTEMRLARLGELLIEAAKRTGPKNNPLLARSVAESLHAATDSLVQKVGIGVPGPGVDVEQYLTKLREAHQKLYLQQGADLQQYSLRSALLDGNTLRDTIYKSFQYPLNWNELPNDEELLRVIKSDDRKESSKLLQKLLQSSLIENILKMHVHAMQVPRKVGDTINPARRRAALEHVEADVKSYLLMKIGCKFGREGIDANLDTIYEDERSLVAYDTKNLTIYAFSKDSSIPGIRIKFEENNGGENLIGFSLTSVDLPVRKSISFAISNELEDRVLVNVRQRPREQRNTKPRSRVGLHEGESFIDMTAEPNLKKGFEKLRSLTRDFQILA